MLFLCLLCFATVAAMTVVCEIFNLLHFLSTAQRGGAWPKWPNGKYASDCRRRINPSDTQYSGALQ